MKLFQLAKELGVGCNEVKQALIEFGADAPCRPFDILSDELAEEMRRVFIRKAFAENTQEESGTPAISSVSAERIKTPLPIRRRKNDGLAEPHKIKSNNLTLPEKIFGRASRKC